MEPLVLDAEDANRLRMMDESCRGDVARQINTDQKDQSTVGETLRLGHVPGREQIAQLVTALRDRGSGGSPANLADLVGSRKSRLQDLRSQILSDGFTWPRFVP